MLYIYMCIYIHTYVSAYLSVVLIPQSARLLIQAPMLDDGGTSLLLEDSTQVRDGYPRHRGSEPRSSECRLGRWMSGRLIYTHRKV